MSVPDKFTVARDRVRSPMGCLKTLSLAGIKLIKQTLHTGLSIQISEKKRGFTKMAHDIRAGYSKNINLFAREAEKPGPTQSRRLNSSAIPSWY